MSRVDSVGIAKQATAGTAQTTMEYFVPVESAEVAFNRETMEVEETVGHRFPTDIDYGTQFFEGTMSGRARAGSFPRVISAFLGAPTTSTVVAGAYQHLFDPAAANKAPVRHSILFNRTDPDPAITDLVYDAFGNSLTVSVGVNEFLGFEAGFVGISNNDTRPEPTVTLDTTPRFSFDEFVAYITIGTGSETAIPISGFSLTYSNNFETDNFVLGQRTLYTLNEGNANAEVSFTPKTALATHYRRALLSDPENVKIRLVATGAMVTGSTPYSFEVTVPRMHYLSAPAPISAADRLTGIDVTARAAYNPSTSKFVEARVVNGVATY
jgi:hypothetical protein